MVLLAVLPAVGAIVYSGIRAQHRAYSNAREEARVIDTSLAEDFKRHSEEARVLVTTLAQVPAILRGGSEQCDRFLRRVMRRNVSMGNIGVINNRGYLACTAVPYSGKLYLGDRSYYRDALKVGKSVLGVFQIGRVVPIPLVVFAAPLPAGARGGRAVVYASMKIAWLDRIVAASKLPKDSTLTVLDAQRHVIARYPDPGKWLGKRVPVLGRLTRSLATNQLDLETGPGLNGKRRLFASYAQSGAGGKPDSYVIVGIPKNEVEGELREALLVSAITLALVTVLFLVLGWWASSKLILARVGILVSTAEQIGKGLRTARTRLKGSDELARLGMAFDEMADSLEVHGDKLESQIKRVNRLNRVYQILTAINGAILRIRDRDALLQEVCRIAVDIGGHPMAWIGLLASESDRVTLAAHAGRNREMIETLYVSVDDSRPEGRGTVGPALRSLKPAVVNDIANEPRMAAWRESLLEIDCLSVATFPLHIQGRVIGNFTLYASQTNYFDEEDIRLFEEVTSNTALGLELIETGEQRDYLAHHDPATGLHNRQHFIMNIGQILRVLPDARQQLCVLAIEVPELSTIADHYGLHVADGFRNRLIPQLQEVLEASDSLAALGTNTFGAALLENGDKSRTDSVVTQLLAMCPFDIEVDGQRNLLTIRIGSASAEQGTDAGNLVRSAEVALRSLEAKSGGKYQAYAREQDDVDSRRYQVWEGLHRAIANDELQVYYQPYQHVATGRYAGAEALVRWHSCDLGPVSPGEFIPVAEAHGIIGDIDAWVFRMVLDHSCAWQDEGIDVGVIGVNMSAKELQDAGIVEEIRGRLAKSGLEPWRCPLALEITETAVVDNFETVHEILDKLRELGLEICLDDYGTGYSSLLYLQRAPLDVLKIDLSFVRRIVEDPTSLALTRSSISLGHSLDLEVIAEGVETEEQLEILKSLGCDYAQGYLYSRPLPKDEFERFIQDCPDTAVRKGRGAGKQSRNRFPGVPSRS